MIPRRSLLPNYRHATQHERNTIREFVASASELLSALTVLPVVLFIVAVTRPRFMESEDECGVCWRKKRRCTCVGGEGGGA
jgi:hypothetical protein